MSYIEKTISNFIRTAFRSNLHNGDANKILDKVQEITNDIDNDLESIKFINQTLEANENALQKHLKTCQNKGKCQTNDQHEELAYKLQKELKKFGIEDLNEDLFTTEEKQSEDYKLDKILEKLSNLHNGQEIIFDEIQELKKLYFLGKKNWRQLAIGKFSEMVAGGVIAESTSKEIMEGLTKDLPKFLGIL